MNKFKQIIRFLFTAFISLAIIAFIILLAVKLSPKPPEEEIREAIRSIAAASSRQSQVYSSKLYAEAVAAYDSAMANWKRENKKFIFFRNYEKVSEYARLAKEKASEAASRSVQNSRDLRSRVSDKIKSLREINSEIDRLFSGYPIREEDRSRLSKGKLLLKEAEIAFDRSQLLQANIKISDAEYLIKTVHENSLEDIKTYFSSFPNWIKWFEESVAESKRNKSMLLVVDKFAHKCYVYIAGIRKYEFEAELGKNWVGDKRVMGDRVTPEGRYKIVRKYQGRATQYHKALALDFPNSEDVERFKREVAAGTISPSSKIGGGIEIHGGGGKGIDWTDGCVALTNKNMDIIYPLVSAGTPVTIVGSLKNLDEILK